MKIVIVVGARPQFIKASSVSRAIYKYNNFAGHNSPLITEIVVHTGQHYDYDMSEIFFSELQVPKPNYFLNINQLSHGAMTGRMMEKIEEVLLNESPDLVLVYGDTNSTLAGALAAVKLYIPVAHIEAGLRSFNRRMPEEINRVLTDHISSLLFCPTETAVKNLENEGISEGILLVGDVMYDAFLFSKELSDKKSNILSKLKLKSGSYCLATVHRQENTDDPSRLFNIFSAFEKLACKECPFIISLHPRTRKNLKKQKLTAVKNQYINIISPINYMDMVALELSARVILTDSGGIQKEAFFAHVPCITLRDETEWIETIETGWNYLAGADTQSIIKAFNTATNSELDVAPNLFGDGNASQLILEHLILASPFEVA